MERLKEAARMVILYKDDQRQLGRRGITLANMVLALPDEEKSHKKAEKPAKIEKPAEKVTKKVVFKRRKAK